LVQDLIALKLRGHHESVREVIKMLAALKKQGSRWGILKKLKGSPLLVQNPVAGAGRGAGLVISGHDRRG
jgi:hypothetical protein